MRTLVPRGGHTQRVRPAAASVLGVLGWSGEVLPPMRLSDQLIQPVVRWRVAALDRIAARQWPTDDRAVLAQWEREGPSSAVEIVGFISSTPTASAVDNLRRLRAYGATAVLIPARGRPSQWSLAEADLAGISVARARGSVGPASLLVRGDSGPIASAVRSTATRLREEQIFDWALTIGYWASLAPANA